MVLFDRPLAAATSLIYVVIVMAIGVWAVRRTHSARDYFIAGQRLGLAVTTLATMSAAFSGFVFLGGPGLTYRLGLASLWIVLPLGLTPTLLCEVAGRRLRRLAGDHEVYTVPDAVAARFDDRRAAGVSAVAVVIGSVGYLAAQLLALGILLQSMLGVPGPGIAILVGLAVLLGYSVFGGMVAGVYTDLFQGALMLIAAIAVFVQALRVSGGWLSLTEGLASSERFGPSFLEPLGGVPVWTAFGFFFVFGVGVLGQPQMLHKFYMLDDPAKLRFMPLTLGLSQAVCLLVWLGVGLAVPSLVAQGKLAPLGSPDEAAPLFLLHFSPDLLAGLVIAAVAAAVMSSADSFANIGSAALVRDLPRAFGRPLPDELAPGRVAVVVLASVAAVLAWAYEDLIALLGTFAFGTFAAALAPTMSVGLSWARVRGTAVTSSILTGAGLNVALELLRRFGSSAWPFPDGVPPSAIALAASFTVLIVVTLATTRKAITPSGGLQCR